MANKPVFKDYSGKFFNELDKKQLATLKTCGLMVVGQAKIYAPWEFKRLAGSIISTVENKVSTGKKAVVTAGGVNVKGKMVNYAAFLELAPAGSKHARKGEPSRIPFFKPAVEYMLPKIKATIATAFKV